MCGIVGIVSKIPITGRERLARQRDTMFHRGPNDVGEWWSADGCAGLAHRRLAIIHLSTTEHQPMLDSTGKVVVALNDEIYNFQELRRELEGKAHYFRSTSKTEFLLAAYSELGTDCLCYLNEAFAFGLHLVWPKMSQTLNFHKLVSPMALDSSLSCL